MSRCRPFLSLAIETFAENARGFCSWAESQKHDLTTVRQLLLALIQGVPYLIVQGVLEGGEYPRRGHERWKTDHKRFADFPFQHYRLVFSPCDIDDDPPVTGDVHDDFADVYADLVMALMRCATGANRISSTGASTPLQRFTRLTSITERAKRKE